MIKQPRMQWTEVKCACICEVYQNQMFTAALPVYFIVLLAGMREKHHRLTCQLFLGRYSIAYTVYCINHTAKRWRSTVRLWNTAPLLLRESHPALGFSIRPARLLWLCEYFIVFSIWLFVFYFPFYVAQNKEERYSLQSTKQWLSSEFDETKDLELKWCPL